MAKPEPTGAETTPKDNKTENQENTDISAIPAISKPVYKPRFQAGMVKPKPTETDEKPDKKADDKTDLPPFAEEPPARPAYKPRFNMKNIPPKATEE